MGDYCCFQMFYNCSGLESSPAILISTAGEHCCDQMFTRCTGMTSAGQISATTLAPYCFYRMFFGCTNLKSADSIYASSMSPYCCQEMFRECANLETAPSMSTVSMAERSCDKMFYGCSKMGNVSGLSISSMAPYCCYEMFYGCSKMTRAPSISSSNMEDRCCQEMFRGCSGMTNASSVTIASMAPYCCYEMFYECSKLTYAPTISANEMKEWCCYEMFYKCIKLVTPPSLNATSLDKYCYYEMFFGCEELESAPELPATVLKEQCYHNMFYNCKNLSGSDGGSRPIVRATSSASYAMSHMFCGCNSLSAIELAFMSDPTESGAYYYWAQNVSPWGILRVPENSTVQDMLPEGWTLKKGPYVPHDPEESDPEDVRYLMVAVAHTTLPGFSDLPGTLLDADGITTLLDNEYEYTGETLISEQATHDAVLQKLEEGINNTPEDGLFIFMYSGHGDYGYNGGEEPEGADPYDEYLALYDQKLWDDEIWSVISRCRGRVLMFIDACHSETMYRSVAPGISVLETNAKNEKDQRVGGFMMNLNKFRMPRDVAAPKILCWSGCREAEVSYETSEGGNLTVGLLRSISQTRNYLEVWARTYAYVQSKNSSQHPVKTNVSGNFDEEARALR